MSGQKGDSLFTRTDDVHGSESNDGPVNKGQIIGWLNRTQTEGYIKTSHLGISRGDLAKSTEQFQYHRLIKSVCITNPQQ